jgi:hypothetical protein
MQQKLAGRIYYKRMWECAYFGIKVKFTVPLAAVGEIALILLQCIGILSGSPPYDLLHITGKPIFLIKCIMPSWLIGCCKTVLAKCYLTL